MAQVKISTETKKKLLADAVSGRDIDYLMFQFIQHDPEFQAEVFKKAEQTENWRFLWSLSEFRLRQRAATAARSRRQPCLEPHRRPRQEQNQQVKRKRNRPLQKEADSLKPTKLKFISLRNEDFGICPKCKTRLPKKSLPDHLDMSCPYRGQAKDPIPKQFVAERPNNTRIVFCHCGAQAMPGEKFCYDHKHT